MLKKLLSTGYFIRYEELYRSQWVLHILGGSVAERLERWTCNLNARSSIPTHDRQLDLLMVLPSTTPQPRL